MIALLLRRRNGKENQMKRIKKAILALILVFSFAIPLPVSAAMNGVGVSSWQTGIEVDEMSMDFVITKATEGRN